MRGLRVALVERGDFAWATSSRSSKLIHGGFRYLPQYQFGLVYHALRERERLRHRTAPHLVKPIRLLFPIYADHGFGRFTVAMGLWLYDLFARIPRIERHESLSAASVRDHEPTLSRSNLAGGALYYDAWTDDARLTFENVLDASLHGAAVANRVAVEELVEHHGKVAAACLRDLSGNAAFELRARAFLNAAGPWVDEVRRMDDASAAPSVRLTKGVHLVFTREALPVRQALVLGDHEDRIVFVMPHERYVLVGTTDTDYAGDPNAVKTEAADIAYLLGVLAESLPGIKLTPDDIAADFAGLRALVIAGHGDSPSSVRREEVILKSRSGLISVAGGKLTTHRAIAENLVNHVMRELGYAARRCLTRKTPLPGARPLKAGEEGAGGPSLKSLSREAREILTARYGSRAAIPAAITLENPALERLLAPGCPAICGEVVHAA